MPKNVPEGGTNRSLELPLPGWTSTIHSVKQVKHVQLEVKEQHHFVLTGLPGIFFYQHRRKTGHVKKGGKYWIYSSSTILLAVSCMPLGTQHRFKPLFSSFFVIYSFTKTFSSFSLSYLTKSALHIQINEGSFHSNLLYLSSYSSTSKLLVALNFSRFLLLVRLDAVSQPTRSQLITRRPLPLKKSYSTIL